MWAIPINRKGAGEFPRPVSNRGFTGGPIFCMMRAGFMRPPRSRNSPRVSHGRDDP